MKSVTYRAFVDNVYQGCYSNNRASSELPILVNCAGLLNIENSFETKMPAGREDYYLMYITSGRMRAFIDGGEHIAEEGNFIIFSPGSAYRYKFSGKGNLSYYFAHFTGSYAKELLLSLFSSHSGIWQAGHSSEVTEAFSAMFEAFATGGKFCDHAAACALERALLALARSFSEAGRSMPLVKSTSYINGNYTSVIKISELASMEGLSPSRYNAVFTQVHNISPLKYIISLRMKHACVLLEETGLNAAEVGAAVGYDDNHFFTKLFKKHVGVSPGAYRSGSRKYFSSK